MTLDDPRRLPVLPGGQAGESHYRKATLILHNCRLFAAGPARPDATLVSVAGGRIQWVGAESDLGNLRGPDTKVIDCQGRRLIPGLIDAHMHLFAYAAHTLGVDCSPRSVDSIAGIKEAIASKARSTAPGSWIRAWGYDQARLAEARHPTRHDLDGVAPTHPVKLTHRSGHASVLNTLAMERLGVTNESPEPPGAVMGRDAATGVLTGYFMEMEEDLAGRGLPTLSDDELRTALDSATSALLAKGVTSIQDATPYRALAQWDVLESMRVEGRLALRVAKMFAPADLPGLEERELFFGAGGDLLNVGPIKLMLNETGPEILPPPEDLFEHVYAAHAAGYQAAFHAVEEAGIAMAADAVTQALQRSIDSASAVAAVGLRLHDHRHRVEHCGICPPELAQRLRPLGIIVITQPGFLAERGERYLAEVPEAKHGWLHPFRSLQEAGLKVAIGSDAPVAPPDPWAAMAAAVTRRSRQGAVVNAAEAISAEAALTAHTAAAAYAVSDEHLKGSVAPGLLADLALLSVDPLHEPEAMAETQVDLTVLGGRVVWER